MHLLAIGDIVGRPGRNAVHALLPAFKKKHKIDLVIANAENIAHGKGITEKTIKEMAAAGVDYFTSGNHIWDNKEALSLLAHPDFPVLRPANFPSEMPGRGYHLFTTKLHKKVLIVNLLGRVLMPGFNLDCPFRTMEKILEEVGRAAQPDAIVVDFHAEATSEKEALGFFLDGKVTALWGTHTHVQTNDARVLSGGTAYMSDLGMTGVRDSVIGVKPEAAIRHFLTQFPFKYDLQETGELMLNGALLTVNTDTGKASSIRPVLELHAA